TAGQGVADRQAGGYRALTKHRLDGIQRASQDDRKWLKLTVIAGQNRPQLIVKGLIVQRLRSQDGGAVWRRGVDPEGNVLSPVVPEQRRDRSERDQMNPLGL